MLTVSWMLEPSYETLRLIYGVNNIICLMQQGAALFPLIYIPSQLLHLLLHHPPPASSSSLREQNTMHWANRWLVRRDREACWEAGPLKSNAAPKTLTHTLSRLAQNSHPHMLILPCSHTHAPTNTHKHTQNKQFPGLREQTSHCRLVLTLLCSHLTTLPSFICHLGDARCHCDQMCCPPNVTAATNYVSA